MMKNMKKLLILITAIILFSGCVQNSQKAVKIGDNVTVDYTGSLMNGKVFDTSIESIAKENNLSVTKQFKPLQLTVGKGQIIKGFEDGIIGMKVGESKTLTIPPEKAYGPKNPQLIRSFPIIEIIPLTRTFPKVLEIPVDQFNQSFGPVYKIGQDVKIPETNINLTIQDITPSNITVLYNLKVGDELSQVGGPWNEIVINVDDKNITTRSEVKKNDIVQLKGVPWNSTVVELDSNNITLKHNSIPDTKIQSPNGPVNIHFNETDIIIDQNSELAGETLIFSVTIRSID